MEFVRSAVFAIFAVLCILSAAASAQEISYSPAPAPGPDAGAGFAASGSIAFICFSLILSLVGIVRQ